MSEIKLLPCPFCGGISMKMLIFGRDGVRCVECGAMMRPQLNEDEEEVIKRWNYRKPIEDMVEQLENACFSPEDDYPGFVIDAEQAVDIVRGGRE